MGKVKTKFYFVCQIIGGGILILLPCSPRGPNSHPVTKFYLGGTILGQKVPLVKPKQKFTLCVKF